jgi:hypothetical protein
MRDADVAAPPRRQSSPPRSKYWMGGGCGPRRWASDALRLKGDEALQYDPNPSDVVPSTRFLIPIGDLDPREAAPLTDAALTSYHAVKRSLHLLGAGATAVVIGVGGLGQMAVQLLRTLSGATTIVALTTRPTSWRQRRGWAPSRRSSRARTPWPGSRT